MKQIFASIIVIFFLVSLALGVFGVVIDFFANDFVMTGEAATVLLTVFLLAVVSPVLLDLLESYFK